MKFATIGTSKVCQRFCDAMHRVEGADYEVCYSRSAEKAQKFATDHGATRTSTSLEAVASDSEVDAVYIASPNAIHAEQAKLMLAHGKNVLVEKSFGCNQREAAEVFEIASANGCVAMEATRNVHAPAFGKISEVVSGMLGQIRATSFGFAKVTSRIAKLRAGERVNIFDARLAAGATMDLGIYTVEPVIALFGEPKSVRAFGVTAAVPGEPEGSPFGRIDLAAQALLDYGEHVVHLSYSKVTDDLTRCQVQGEAGTLTFAAISNPYDLRVHVHEDGAMVFNVKNADLGEPVCVEQAENDMVYELGDFMDAAEEGPWGPLATHYRDVTLGSLAVMDQIRAQLGVRFPQDA